MKLLPRLQFCHSSILIIFFTLENETNKQKSAFVQIINIWKCKAVMTLKAQKTSKPWIVIGEE